MGAYKQLAVADKDMILSKFAELGSALNGNAITKKASTLSETEKNQIVSSMLNDPTGRGLRRISNASPAWGQLLAA